MFLENIIQSTQQRMNLIHSGFDFPFYQALSSEGMSFICEVKKASPSKGLLAEHYPYLDIAKEYESAGASAISVLTEPDYFLGSGEHLKEISQSAKIPTLRKDFVIDPYQIYEAKVWGASAVLLIAEILDEETLSQLIQLAERLGLSTLVESHSLPQLQKSLRCGAKIVGVNNRNLETFEVDITTSMKLREYVPDKLLYVAESGISSPKDIELLKQSGVDAVLIGEAFMRSPDKTAMLRTLRGISNEN